MQDVIVKKIKLDYILLSLALGIKMFKSKIYLINFIFKHNKYNRILTLLMLLTLEREIS